jgi:hypothetical protein
MEQPVTAVYDANILYPAPLRNVQQLGRGQQAQTFVFTVPRTWGK